MFLIMKLELQKFKLFEGNTYSTIKFNKIIYVNELM
jgi:hypothetical protein